SCALELLIWSTGAALGIGDRNVLREISELATANASGGSGDGSTHVFEALAAIAHASADPKAGRTIEAAYAWAATANHAHSVFTVSVASFFQGDYELFAGLISRAIHLARDRGQVGILAEALNMRGVQLLMIQRFDEATAAAREAAEFAGEYGA